MADLKFGGLSDSPANSYPLSMDRSENVSNSEHVIDITRGTGTTSVTASTVDDPLALPQGAPSGALRAPESLPSVASVNAPSGNNSTNLRRGDNRRRRSPLNSGVSICIELLLTISQIVASVVVLFLSKHEEPQAPLQAWIIGYAAGCVAVLPLLYWRYHHRNQSLEQDSGQNSEISVQGTLTAGTRLSVSFIRPSVEDNRQTAAATGAASGNSRNRQGLSNSRLKAIMEYFKMGLDCLFAIWFVVGNVWIFGGSSSASEAPHLYWLCIVFLTLSCIGYAMPFILCATICCCLPCIISVLGYREDMNQTRGATSESINALPTCKFKLKKIKCGSGMEQIGVVAAGTDKERVIPAEDAACCICLARYAHNDDLRELPCSHFHHKDCVDKWLKINATCPLCKCEVGVTIANSNASQEATLSNVAN